MLSFFHYCKLYHVILHQPVAVEGSENRFECFMRFMNFRQETSHFSIR